MTRIASMAKLKIAAAPEKYEAPSDMSVNVKKHKGMDGVDVGKKIHFQGHGAVTSIHKDDMGHTMRIEIHHVEPRKEKI